MDSSSVSFNPESREEDFHCPTHGTHKITRMKLFSEWLPARCPSCEAEQAATQIAEDQARKERQQAEAQKRLLRDLFSQSAIPPRFEGRGFGNYIVPKGGDPVINFQMEKARDICLAYAEQFPDRLAKGSSLILCGNTGTGKTHLACAIAHHVISQHQKSAVYMTVGRAFRMVKETYNRDSEQSERQALESFRRPDLLILDEIGVQYGTDAERNILFEIVNERYESLKPTIIISNLALPALAEYAGDRVVDRLKENGGRVIIFDWKSRRAAE